MKKIRAVTVQVRKTRSERYFVYTVTIPKEFAEELKINKGDILHVVLIEVTINGRKVKGILYFKPL